jgi:hypothetical protein
MGKRKPSAARVRKLRQDPGNRSKLDLKDLTPEQQRQRLLNQRLDSPIVDGSSMTQRDLARTRESVLQQSYGPQEAQIKDQLARGEQRNRDTAGWYDLYRQQLAQAAQNQQANAMAANQALTGLTQVAGQIGTGVAPGASQGNVTDAQNSAAIRQQLLAGFGALTANTGRNQANYAETLANVVAPGQKLQAQVAGVREQEGVRGKQTDLLRERAAAGLKFEQDVKADEAKSVLAQQALGLDVAKTQASIADQAADNARADQELEVKKNKPVTGYGPKGSGLNKFGYSYDEWEKLSEAEKSKIRAGKDKPGKPNGGRGWAPSATQGKTQSQIADALQFAKQYKKAGKNRHQVAQALLNGMKSQPKYEDYTDPQTGTVKRRRVLKDGVPVNTAAIPKFEQLLASVALDIAYDGHISRANVKKLHARGIRINDLGYPTRVKARPKRTGAQAYDKGSVPG